jgi:hypothetical protein
MVETSRTVLSGEKIMPIPSPEYKSFYRKTRRKVSSYKSENGEFVESITHNDFMALEKWMRSFTTGGCPKKKDVELAKLEIKNLPEKLHEYAWMRFDDYNKFRKIYQQIQYRWNDIQQNNYKKKFNEEFKWRQLANGILNRQTKKEVEKEWTQDKSLLIEYLKMLYEKQNKICPLSKQPMVIERNSPNSPSVDRIDSTKGYIKGNIQITCVWANRMKFDLPIDEFIDKIEILHKSFEQDATPNSYK